MNLQSFFQIAIEKNASDLHLIEGAVPVIRVAGELIKLGEEEIPFGELRYSVFLVLDERSKERFERKKDIDISMEFFDNRFRVNIHSQSGKVGLAARLIPKHIPRPEEIGLNSTIYNLTHSNDGLILITGPSGVGKSTTLATMIDIINQERSAHIITIEDPVEYTFKNKKSVIEQRQLGLDTNSFSSALKFSLRQDPNVIMVGEMRDLETIQAVLTAAKTGHLVLSTLHTSTTAETVERIVDYFPSHHQQQILHQLASVLRAAIAQELLPKVGGGLIAAREIMICNNAISNLIRNDQMEQIISVLQTSRREGMVTMNKSIENLYRQGLISKDTARNRTRNMETHMARY